MKIAALVSGGVDSSVALALLKQQGHDVTAFYIKIWLEDELSFLGTCPWEQDLDYVRQVCDQLNVPLQVVSLQKEYHDAVVAYTIAQAKAGNTPNPDVLCNKQIKFGAFYTKFGNGFDAIATGHYAQVQEVDGIKHLMISPDEIKDQTYFLAHLSQEQVAKAIFPIGHLRKEQVRALAHEFNLATKDRKDSQGICFLGKLKFKDFLKHHLGEQSGSIKEYETGKVLGKHQGYWFHTVGQRQGLGLAGGPWYVVQKDIKENVVWVSSGYYNDDKIRNKVTITHCNWITGKMPIHDKVMVKLRHGAQAHEATISFGTADQMQLHLNNNDQGIAPGQFAVLYQNNECLGSGVII